jgi:hypothetical protein
MGGGVPTSRCKAGRGRAGASGNPSLDNDILRMAADAAVRLPDAIGFGDREAKRLKALAPTDETEAEAEKRHRFAVRANSILAFIECDEEQRPKLREAIVEAMLWAQAQPK